MSSHHPPPIPPPMPPVPPSGPDPLSPNERERMEELLADMVTCGLSDAQERELESLVKKSGGEDSLLEMELAAASSMLASLPRGEGMPAALRAKVEAQASNALAGRERAPAVISRASSDQRVERSGGGVLARINSWAWVAAAACLLLAVLGWWPRLSADRLTPEELAARQGTFTTRWALWSAKPPTEDPAAKEIDWAKEVKGRVIWNSQLQEGFMIFEGMAPNDPQVAQYQLWIIYKNQKQPIDGGVFDIEKQGESVVRITPKIKVSEPVAFAVTIEKPGGVVVSEQHERVVVAPVD